MREESSGRERERRKVRSNGLRRGGEGRGKYRRAHCDVSFHLKCQPNKARLARKTKQGATSIDHFG
jgi:chloramphenicol 3-O-phosphotransferase